MDDHDTYTGKAVSDLSCNIVGGYRHRLLVTPSGFSAKPRTR
jgi:hypothetical protein